MPRHRRPPQACSGPRPDRPAPRPCSVHYSWPDLSACDRVSSSGAFYMPIRRSRPPFIKIKLVKINVRHSRITALEWTQGAAKGADLNGRKGDGDDRYRKSYPLVEGTNQRSMARLVRRLAGVDPRCL